VPELLLVGVGLMGRPYVQAAHRLGLSVHAVEAQSRAAALDGVVEHVTLSRGETDEAWAEAAAAAAAARRPDGVVAFSEPHALAAALVATERSLPGPSLHATVLSRNKALQRGRFAAAGIPQPEYLVAAGLAPAAGWVAERFPVVLKPPGGSGSLGIEAVFDAAAYREAAQRRPEPTLLVERLVTGPEYSWEALVEDGRVWLANVTAKETSGPPHFVEVGHRLGFGVEEAVERGAHALGADVVAALGLGSGIVHLEFRWTDAGPVVMEVAVRTPGDFLMDLLGVVHGVDWFEVVVRLAVGLPLPEPPAAPVACAVAYIPPTDPGVVTAIEGLEEVRAHPSVLRADVWAEVGETLPPVRWSADRRIVALLSAPEPAEVEAALRFTRERLRIVTAPEAAA
jgi:biotin carboxylase